MSTITIYSDRESWVTGVADFITELATEAIVERGRFTFALVPVQARRGDDAEVIPSG